MQLVEDYDMPFFIIFNNYYDLKISFYLKFFNKLHVHA